MRFLGKTMLWGLAFLVVICVSAGAIWMEFQSLLEPVTSEKKEIVVNIPPGSSAGYIGRILEKNGVIRSGDAFRYLVAYKKVGSRLKAGEHILDGSMSTPQVLKSLMEGHFKLYPVTVPEGLTITEIATLVHNSGLADREAFIQLCHNRSFISSLGLEQESLEGYLFPETYHFIRGATTKGIIKAMVDRFFTIWEQLEPLAAQQELTRHEIVTLASIVEKETGAAVERPIIASVFLNRLAIGMRLETDPTVIYGIEDFDGNITKKHLQTPTPYNTYVIKGLPPGPIANPGEASLRAVLEPAREEYLFFVSKNDGTHHFSKSLREHNNAVNKYQRRSN